LNSLFKEKVMKWNHHTVLVTGGATGIGEGLARSFALAGSKVIICGRRPEALSAAERRTPGLLTRVCDVADPRQRLELADWVGKNHPELDILVNNAGVQERMLVGDGDFWTKARSELAINLEAPLHLTSLLLPLLEKRQESAIVNVTSGLAFVPMAQAPVYSATKAALHSWTLSLRHQLQGRVEVVEVVPPAVNTDLGGVGLHTTGTPLEEFLDAVVRQINEGKETVTYGFSNVTSQASPEELKTIFARMNGS
jgi:uncharacterized oxidoreductase